MRARRHLLDLVAVVVGIALVAVIVTGARQVGTPRTVTRTVHASAACRAAARDAQRIVDVTAEHVGALDDAISSVGWGRFNADVGRIDKADALAKMDDAVTTLSTARGGWVGELDPLRFRVQREQQACRK